MASGDFIEFPIEATNTRPLSVTICWTDPPGTPPAASVDPTNRMLINDLDLRLIRGSTTNLPWVLDPNNRTAAATTADNVRDNVEQVFIGSPTTGTYTVRVTHKGDLLNDTNAVSDQRVSIIISGNLAQPAPALAFTSITQVSSNIVALKWESVVGRVYQVDYRDDVASGAWQAATVEISATKTNVTVALTMPSGVPNRFFRLAQLR